MTFDDACAPSSDLSFDTFAIRELGVWSGDETIFGPDVRTVMPKTEWAKNGHF